jgi:hypothetical protein
MSLQPKWQDRLSDAIRHFWKTRQRQSDHQGARTGTRDAGSRTAVTGGKQLDGFVELLRDFLAEAGLDHACIYTSQCHAEMTLQKILVIGSGPIVIGQSAEFDYSGTQACKALMAEGYEVVLVNSNPATIMTDPELADRTYIEPLTREYVEEIHSRRERQMLGQGRGGSGKFALLPTVGGQTALNLAVDLADAGILDKYGVEMIGAKLEAIKKAEDRLLFKDAMTASGLEVSKSALVNNLRDGMEFAQKMAFRC